VIDIHHPPAGISCNGNCAEQKPADATEYRSLTRSHCIVDAMELQLSQRSWSLIHAKASGFHFHSQNSVTAAERDVHHDIHNPHCRGLSPRNQAEQVPEQPRDDDVPVEPVSPPNPQTRNRQSKPVGSTCRGTDNSDPDFEKLWPNSAARS